MAEQTIPVPGASAQGPVAPIADIPRAQIPLQPDTGPTPGSEPTPQMPAMGTQPTAPGGAAPLPAKPKMTFGSVAHSAFNVLKNTMNQQPTEWAVNPTTGKLEAKPGEPDSRTSIFKHILAGALIGGATAQQAHNQNPQMGFGGGVVAGGAGQMARAEQQKEKAQQQARLDFQQKQEQQKLDQDKLQSQATIAHLNADTYARSVEAAQHSYEASKALGEIGRDVSSWFENVPDMPKPTILNQNQVHDYIKSHPNAQAEKYFINLGPINERIDANGQINFDQQFAAYDVDPSKPIPVNKNMIDRLADSSELEKKYGNLREVLTGKSSIDFYHLSALLRQQSEVIKSRVQDHGTALKLGEEENVAKASTLDFAVKQAQLDNENLSREVHKFELQGEKAKLAAAQQIRGAAGRWDKAVSAARKSGVPEDQAFQMAFRNMSPSDTYIMQTKWEADRKNSMLVVHEIKPDAYGKYEPGEYEAKQDALAEVNQYQSLISIAAGVGSGPRGIKVPSSQTMKDIADRHTDGFVENPDKWLVYDPTLPVQKDQDPVSWVTPDQGKAAVGLGAIRVMPPEAQAAALATNWSTVPANKAVVVKPGGKTEVMDVSEAQEQARQHKAQIIQKPEPPQPTDEQKFSRLKPNMY